MDGLYIEIKPFKQFMTTKAFEQLHAEYF